MIPIQYIRESRDEVVNRLKIRGIEADGMIDEILTLDARKRQLQTALNENLSEANGLAKQIGGLFKEGKASEANELKSKTAVLKEGSKALDKEMQKVGEKLQDLLYQVPNTPHPGVPLGKLAEDNEIVGDGGSMPNLYGGAQPHWELADRYDLIDFELGAKITGAGFPVYRGQGARLQRALINFFIDEALDQGYFEIQPPLLINADSGYGTGQLPDKEGQMYEATVDNLYLIPTAEVPITNMYRNVIVKAEDFPIKNVGYTPCFRREAGAYGKDVRGLNRLHQFDKVEIVQVVHPAQSYAVLEDMVKYVEGLLIKLELPYRIAKLCGGDMGFTSALTYDMEVYSAAQDKWLEVSSISNFEAFQANRLKLRFKDEDGKMTLAHTLNGSALALPRIVAALLENNQIEDSINIPEALRPYTRFDKISTL